MSRTVLTVSELLPPAVEQGALSESVRADYEAALTAFLEGRWEDVRVLFRRWPQLKTDGATRFLQAYVDKHHGAPPPDWDGIIKMEAK